MERVGEKTGEKKRSAAYQGRSPAVYVYRSITQTGQSHLN